MENTSCAVLGLGSTPNRAAMAVSHKNERFFVFLQKTVG